MPRAKPATVDRFGRVLIPKALREFVGLRGGTEVEIVPDEQGVRLMPREQGVLLKKVGGVLVASGEASGDLAAAVHLERRKRVRKLTRRKR